MIEALLIAVVFGVAPHWPVVAFVAACTMAVADLAIVACTALYAVGRLVEWLGIDVAPQVASNDVQCGQDVS